ncbi:MAG: pitrilysin family protein [Schleiferiaceae bacterium]|nr:pitrilysin family protein [Schleiferiaceae bacterium]MDR9441501.1 pitrilysin family protein [Schleiferiaceae bacterium]
MLKRITNLLLIITMTCGALTAQIDRSQPPEAKPAKPLEFGKYKVKTLKNGLTLILVEDHKLPRTTAYMVVDRKPVQEGDKAGYVSLAGQMLRQGTQNLPKDSLDKTIDYLGADLSTSSSSAYVSGLSKYNERLIQLLADVALNPAFPKEEFDKLKKQSLSNIESARDNPDQLSARLFNHTLYGGNHPYGELETKETLENIELEDCRNYYQKYWAPNRTYLAIIGDIKKWKTKRWVKKYFGDWEEKEVPQPQYESPKVPSEPIVNIINRSSSSQTKLKLGNTIDLKPGEADVLPLRLANQILGVGSMGRLFQNLREDKGFTYGAYSSYDTDKLVGEFSAGADVRTEVTDSAVSEFLAEFDSLRTQPVSSKELQGAKNYIAGGFGRSLESPQTLARFALNIERYDLPENYYETYLERMDKVTAEGVREAAAQYIKPEKLTITAVGKGAVIGEKLEAFGTVHYFNFEGDTVEAPNLPVPEGLSAQEVIQSYVKALGGQEKLDAVTDLTMHMNASIQGLPPTMEATSTVKRKRPNYYLNQVEVSGMGTVNKQLYDGEKGVVSGMRGTKTLEGEELAELKNSARFFIETQYQDLNYKMELTGAEMVEDQKAYAVKITAPNGLSHTDYYAAESGLKVKEVSSQETPQGNVTSVTFYGDYQEVGGVMFPHEIKVTSPQKVTLDVKEIKVNESLSEEDFQ